MQDIGGLGKYLEASQSDGLQRIEWTVKINCRAGRTLYVIVVWWVDHLLDF